MIWSWLIVGGLYLMPASLWALSEPPGDIEKLEESARVSPKNHDVWIDLGTSLLDRKAYVEAEEAFKRALRIKKSAAAHNGLGLAYLGQEKKRRRALVEFRKARSRDRENVEIQMNLARAHILMGNEDAEKELRKAIKMDPGYAPALLALAEWYRDKARFDEMLAAYRSYVRANPDDVEGQIGLALSYTEQKQYALVLTLAGEMWQARKDVRFLALLAQAYAARGEPDRALGLFKVFLKNIPDDQRAQYEDLSLVATRGELDTYEMTPDSLREAFLQDFWKKRDFTLVSGGKARRAEHYRRVWYARTYFGASAFPWDKRGEVYIRYGEPNYRSRSYATNEFPSLAVQSIKDRNAEALYRRGARYDTSLPIEIARIPEVEHLDEDYDVMSAGVRPDMIAGMDSNFSRMKAAREAAIGGSWSWEIRVGDDVYLHKPPDLRSASMVSPVFPIPRGSSGLPSVPWESWVYTNVGGGVEFVFIDEFMNGAWDFPGVPPVHHGALAIQMLEYAPAPMLMQLSSVIPDYYDVPPGIEPIAFWYDFSTFMGADGNTRLEVYVGIPPDQIGFKDEEGLLVGEVVRTVVITDRERNEIERETETLRFARGDKEFLEKASFIPDVVGIELAPGDYLLAIQLTDRVSGKWGIYHQELAIPSYGDSLALSDLEVAYSVTSVPGDRRFQKDDVWVVPLPTRNYRTDQRITLYYEIYNLRRDEFGQTRYRIAYAVKQEVRRSSGLFGAVASGFGHLFSRKVPEVIFEYEATGTREHEPIYFEIEAGKMKKGLNEITVVITDLNTLDSVEKAAIFRLSERDKEDNPFVDDQNEQFDDMMKQ